MKQHELLGQIAKAAGPAYTYLHSPIYGHCIYRASDRRRVWNVPGAVKLTPILVQAAVDAIEADRRRARK